MWTKFCENFVGVSERHNIVLVCASKTKCWATRRVFKNF